MSVSLNFTIIDKVIKNKRGLELVTNSLQVMKQVQKNSFISYILSVQVWWFNIKQFFSYSKNYFCKFMQSNSWHHKLFHLICPSLFGKCGKERKKLQKFEYLKNKKSFLDEIKDTFHSFFFFFHFPIIYLSLAISFFNLCLFFYSNYYYCYYHYVELTLTVFLRNQVGETFKQGIQAAWPTPIYHVKWWISHLRGVYRTLTASEMELFFI